jgi:Arc/MetJ family transcription regulator
MHGNQQMRTTLNIDDELLEQAAALTGLNEKTALVRAGLRALIERETARRLASLGGSDPGAKAPPRRRPAAR